MSQVDPAVSSKCSSGWTVDWAQAGLTGRQNGTHENVEK